MDFRESAAAICQHVTNDDLAGATGASVPSIKQARLPDDAAGHRSPPLEWRTKLAHLAHNRAQYYLRLAAKIRVE